MSERLVVQLCEIILALAAFGGVAVILAATWHDMVAIAKKARLDSISSNLSKTKRPSITIFITVQLNEVAVEKCIQSILANDYGRYNIVVIHDKSQTSIKQFVSNYKKTHSPAPISTHAINEPPTLRTSLQRAYQKSRKSDLVLVLDADATLSPNTLRDCAAHFIADDSLNTLRIRRHFEGSVTLATLADFFADLSRNLVHKSLSWRRISQKRVYQGGVISRATTFANDTPSTPLKAGYASLTTFTSPARSKATHVNIRNTAILVITAASIAVCLGLMTYFFYTAATLQSNALLTYSWTVVSLWLFAVVWFDELLPVARKIELTITIPFMYFILYVQLFVGLFKTLWRLAPAISLPALNGKALYNAILIEAYSTRF